MNDKVKHLFDIAATDYDRERKGLIPCYDDFYGMAIKWLELDAGVPAILDLGAGTGLLTSFVLARYPQAKMTLIDFSSDMLSKAKERLKNYADITYVTSDYTQHSFDTKFDAIVSSLSIHHLVDSEKKKLFATLYEQLQDGGYFINADQVAGSSSWFDQQYESQWEESVLASGLSQQALDASKERCKEDRNASLQNQLLWLQEAGFCEVDCVYRYNQFAVFIARK